MSPHSGQLVNWSTLPLLIDIVVDSNIREQVTFKRVNIVVGDETQVHQLIHSDSSLEECLEDGFLSHWFGVFG